MHLDPTSKTKIKNHINDHAISLTFRFIPDEDTFDGLGHDRSPLVLEIHNRWSPWRHRRLTTALGGSDG